MSPTTNSIEAIMHRRLHTRIISKHIDQRKLARFHLHILEFPLGPTTVYSPSAIQPTVIKRKVYQYCADSFLKSWRPERAMSQPPYKSKNDAIIGNLTLKYDLCQTCNKTSSYMWAGYPCQQTLTAVRNHSHIITSCEG